MNTSRIRPVALLIALGLCLANNQLASAQAPVQQVFNKYCTDCHYKDDPKGDLDLTSYASVMENKRAVAGKPGDSLVYKYVTSEGKDVMPPKNKKKRPTDEEKEIIKAWIVSGAPDFTRAVAPVVKTPSIPNAQPGQPTPPAQPGDLELPDQPPIGSGVIRIPTGPEALGPGGKTVDPKPNTDTKIEPKPNIDTKVDADKFQKPLGTDYVHAVILNHVRKLNREQRRHTRYFSLAHLATLGTSKKELEQHRLALAKAINHLHWEYDLVQPEQVDAEGTVFALDLRRVGWHVPALQSKTGTLNVYDLVLLQYPYGVVATGSPAYADLVREYFSVANPVRPVPYVLADWFVCNATQAPLYHEMLFLPKTAKDLEEKGLQIDVQRSIEFSGVARGGMVTTSGVSTNSRVVERFQGKRGFYWRSYDYLKSSGTGSIIRDPVNLRPDGGEMIFQLPNGFQAYLIFNGAGARVDEAPVTIVVDKLNGLDGVVRNGLSCIRCHSQGMQTFKDEVRPQLERLGTTNALDVRRVRQLYPEQRQLDELLKRDSAIFMNAWEKLAGSKGVSEPLKPVSKRFLEDKVPFALASAELGQTDSTGLERVFAQRRLLRSGLTPLAIKGENQQIRRDAWEESYPDVVREMGLGTPIVPLDASNRLEYDPVERPFRFGVSINKSALQTADRPATPVAIRSGAELELRTVADREVYMEAYHTAADGKKTVIFEAETKRTAKETCFAKKVKINGKAGQKETITVLVSAKPFRSGELMQGLGVEGRLIHRYSVTENNGQVLVEDGMDPTQTIKRTYTIEVR